MQLSRSLFAVTLAISLISLPIKTQADLPKLSDGASWALGGALALSAAFVYLRTPSTDANKNVAVKALDATTKYSHKATDLAVKYLPAAAFIGGAGWLGVHNTNVLNSNFVEFISNVAKAKPVKTT